MKTKVLLMTDVENLGHVGDVVEVAGGYARNYLLPRGLAAAPTVEAMRAAAKERERLEKERQIRLAALKKVAERMTGLVITISAAANEEGHLYGSVSARDIVARLAEVGYPDLQPSQVRMEHALREVGEHAVVMHLGEEIDAEIKVTVAKSEEQVAEDVDKAEESDEMDDTDDEQPTQNP
jgi:large subunit ribosomal protein L9